MQIVLDNISFNVYITRKSIKNMYLRVKVDGIYISCNHLVPKAMILSFIKQNQDSIIESYNRLQKKEQKKEEFYYLGNKYDVIILNTVSKIEFVEDKVFVKIKNI